ncbi:folylpolyglutamate synthase/dihydrofolate synthase family protein [Actinomadura harenae]|uniref:Bifunctional folylpolyglutamate synthase/dihydrofolate synthase n=1 Tax=Actinomadura harenae TaxID=2483351 RepID=A0A3M2M908_9ACTN|nr:hypothetical protein [Actinomadura harenae]RMI45969.1 hypothetical protein EBO15_08675 [Actinomadura harenae]
MAVDQVFFREWTARRPGSRRSLERARELAGALGLLPVGVPVLAVVGSKGKGTAATYASATLVAAGLRVVSVMSPGHRSNRDRIRVDGRAVSPDEFAELASRLSEAMDGLPEASEGYLSPSGLFTLASLVHARDVGADVVVLEAGMGGGSDEISLFPATVVAVTPIFAEHVGVLGDTIGEIATEKAAVIVPETRAVVSAPQSPEVRDVLDAAGDIHMAVDGPQATWATALPQGLSRANARTGVLAALRLAEVLGRPPAGARVREMLGTVVLPGRLSLHERDGVEVLIDSAINRDGVAAALRAARARWGGEVDHVLLCLPDHKDLDGAIAELDGLPVTFVRLPQAHLRFSRPLPSSWDVLDAAELSMDALADRGPRLLTLGTVYFAGLVLNVLDADVDRLFG